MNLHPRVSFVIPCYKLAHLLGECIESILSQSYADFEILIMDDYSPDNTPEVAKSFHDSRVIHVRNNPNLGHLRNYNKGIDLARGEYIWLISADDRLRTRSAVQRYLDVMDAHSEVGFAFCPGHGLLDSHDTGLMEWTVYRDRDTILKGQEFLNDLLDCNFILAPSGLVRRQCYEQLGKFPEDMPYGGDWYLWSLFALHYDVAFIREPLVDYRLHDLSMTNLLRQQNIRACVEDDLALPVRIWREAMRIGAIGAVRRARRALAEQYSRALVSFSVRGTTSSISLPEFENRIEKDCRDPLDRREIAGLAFELAGDRLYWNKEFVCAREMYWRALQERASEMKLWAKLAFVLAGDSGMTVRKRIAMARHTNGAGDQGIAA